MTTDTDAAGKGETTLQKRIKQFEECGFFDGTDYAFIRDLLAALQSATAENGRLRKLIDPEGELQDNELADFAADMQHALKTSAWAGEENMKLLAENERLRGLDVVVQDLSLLLRRCLHKHGKGTLTYDDIMSAMDYLKRKDLLGSPLRDDAALSRTQEEQ